MDASFIHRYHLQETHLHHAIGEKRSMNTDMGASTQSIIQKFTVIDVLQCSRPLAYDSVVYSFLSIVLNCHASQAYICSKVNINADLQWGKQSAIITMVTYITPNYIGKTSLLIFGFPLFYHKRQKRTKYTIMSIYDVPTKLMTKQSKRDQNIDKILIN